MTNGSEHLPEFPIARVTPVETVAQTAYAPAA